MHFLHGKRAVMVFLAVATVLLLPLAAQATLYSFDRVNDPEYVNPDTASQYLVDVAAVGTGQVSLNSPTPGR